MKVEMLWVVMNNLVVRLLRNVVDTSSWSGISVKSMHKIQNQGIPGQPGLSGL